MLRDLMVTEHLAADVTFAADVPMVTGMGAVKDFTSKTLKLTAGETATDIVFAQKERIPTGYNAARTNMSDYDPDFTNVEKGAKVVSYFYPADSLFATDQYDDTIVEAAAGKRVSWKNGKATVATIASPYEFVGFYNDCGHILAKLYRHDTAETN